MTKKYEIKIKRPKDFTKDMSLDLSEEVRNYVIKRSLRGLDKNNNNFASYSKSYAESDVGIIAGKKEGQTANLRLTGEMLESLKNKSITKSDITIGYDNRRKNLLGKVEGNVEGTYGDRSRKNKKPRDFLGIEESDLIKIVEKVRKRYEKIRKSNS